MAPAQPFWSATGSLAELKVGRQPQPAGVLPRCENPTVEADAVLVVLSESAHGRDHITLGYRVASDRAVSLQPTEIRSR